MASLRMVLWNMEWMNDLFGPNDQPPAFKPDNAEPAHHRSATVRKRRDDLAGVLKELQPDIVVVVEGPNRAGELQLFFDQDMPGIWKAGVQHSKGQSQNVGIAVRVDEGKFNDPPFKQFDTNNMDEFGPFHADTDDDEVMEEYKFERRPLYAEINPKDGKVFRVLGLHLKSKGIFSAYEWSKWWQVADGNRRKLLAQATQLRLRFLDPYLTGEATRGIPLIVCGDINDGPGLDASEKRLYGSAVERLMGTIWKPELCLRNALYDALAPKDREALNFEKIVTASFRDPIFNNVTQREWIDHILYTAGLGNLWVTGAQAVSRSADGRFLWDKYKYASDHFPIAATVTT